MRMPSLLVTLLAVAVLVAGGLTYTRWQREIGRRDQLIAQLEVARKLAVAAADSLSRRLHRDTVYLTRYRQRTDTMTVTVEQWKHDTVKVVEYVAKADSTIRQCSVALETCGRLVEAQRRRAEAGEAALIALKAQPPQPVHKWRHRAEGAVLGVAVGTVIGWFK